MKVLLNTLTIEEQTYPKKQIFGEGEFARYYLNQDAFVVRAVEDIETQLSGYTEVLSAFYLKPNFPGRCSHICNPGFIVQPTRQVEGKLEFAGKKRSRTRCFSL